MTRSTIFATSLALAAMSHTPAHSQSALGDEESSEVIGRLAVVVEEDLAAGLGESAATGAEIASLATSNVRFSAANGKDEASLTLNILRGASSPLLNENNELEGHSFASRSLSLTLAHATGEGSTTLINRSGFATGTSLALSFTSRVFSVGDTSRIVSVLRDAQRECLSRYASGDGKIHPNANLFFAAVETEAATTEPLGGGRSYEIGLDRLDPSRFGTIAAAARSVCFTNAANDGAFVQQYLGDERSREISSTMFGTLHFFGGQAKIERVSLDYIDTTAFTKADDQAWSYAASVHYGIQGSTPYGPNGEHRRLWSARAILSYERGWDEADEVNVCQPQAGTLLSNCLSSPGMPATRETAWTLSAEGRVAGRAFGIPVGIAPSVGVRLDNGDVTLALPVYLVGDSDDNLTAGIRADYETGDDDVGVAIFVTSAFGQIFR